MLFLIQSLAWKQGGEQNSENILIASLLQC